MLNKFLRENKVSKMSKQERNAWYNALSKPEKAVAVCEDVLLQIKNKKYVMTEGTYVELEFSEDVTQRTVNDILKKEALDELLGAKSVTCNVCAIGSTFLSCVRLGNEVESDDILSINDGNKDFWDDYEYQPGSTIEGDQEVAFKKLQEVFTEKEFRAMEYIFESAFDVTNKFTTIENQLLLNHYDEEYDDLYSEGRMIKMCKQIIKDKGYFLVEGVDLENTNK